MIITTDLKEDYTIEEAIKITAGAVMEINFRELIGVSIGEASMCWSETPSGVFDSTRAKEIYDKLIAAVEQLKAENENLKLIERPKKKIKKYKVLFKRLEYENPFQVSGEHYADKEDFEAKTSGNQFIQLIKESEIEVEE